MKNFSSINELENEILSSKEEIKNIEGIIKDTDILSDFDGTMVKGGTQYKEILFYFLSHECPFKFFKEITRTYSQYKKSKNPIEFYKLFEGCPVEILDKIAESIQQNHEWNKLISKLKPKQVGIISRNSERLISRYLDLNRYLSPQTRLIMANIPEVKNNTYTGNADILVDFNTLIKITNKKPYICGREEKKALEKMGIYAKRASNGLYICERTKFF